MQSNEGNSRSKVENSRAPMQRKVEIGRGKLEIAEKRRKWQGNQKTQRKKEK